MLTVELQMNLFNAIAYTDPHETLDAAMAVPPDRYTKTYLSAD
jgi:hypothetical protein